MYYFDLISANYLEKRDIELETGDIVNMMIYDTAGQEEYEKIGITTNEKYEFRIYDDAGSKNLFRRFGIISRLGFSKGAQDPATWNATIEFTVGEDVTVD